MESWIIEFVDYLMSMDALAIYGLGFTVLLACGLGVPIPEDITLLLMGYMTYHAMPDGSPRPHASVTLAVLVGLAGVMIGDGFIFYMGHRFGVKLLDKWPFSRMLGGGRLERARRFINKNGPKVLFSARFMPGLRSVVFFTSATLAIPYRRFLIYDGLAALLSVPALVLAAWYWGEQFDRVVAKARQAEHGILAIILVAAVVLVVKHLIEKRARPAEPESESAPGPGGETGGDDVQ